tara:strand:- start:596 stop:2305 length:1710 start_codon:yes stop_codon:yes gene_type:complete
MNYLSKFYLVLKKKEKIKVSLIFLFSIVSLFLEMIGITMILPVLTILLDGNLDQIYFKPLEFLINFFKSFDNQNLLNLTLFTLIIVFLIKNFFLFLFNFFNYKIVNNISARISSSVFKKYLNNDYKFHLKNNSNVLINNCITVVDAFKDTFISFLIFLTEILVLLGILFVLLIFEPRGFLLCLTFIFSLGMITFFLSNKILVKWGREAIDANEKRFFFLSQAFDSIREIKVFDNKNYFVNKYYIPNRDKYRISALISAVNSVPKYVLELAFVITLSILLIFLNYISYNTSKIIIIMGLFSLATIRIIPSLNKIFTSFQILKFGHHAIDKIYQEFLIDEQKSENKSNFTSEKLNKSNINTLVSLKNVYFKYDDKGNDSLMNVSLDIFKKELLVILGKSGSGKTTLINLILGLLKPSQGKIVTNFNNPSFVSQSPYLLDDTIKNNIALGVEEKNIDLERVNACIEKAQLKDFVKSQEKGIDTIIGEKGDRISGGELQRLALARAFYRKPDIIILDEPTSSLDKITEKNILEILSSISKECSVVVITHNLDNTQYCDRIMKIDNKEIKISNK